MKAVFSPFVLSGKLFAPPSKSLAHRYLISAALSRQRGVISGVDYSEDILATLDCLRALGVTLTVSGDAVTVEAQSLDAEDGTVLNCRESGSTLRFFLPLALCLGKKITLCGSRRLFQRPLGVYEELCAACGFFFEKKEDSVTVCGTLSRGTYRVQGDVSSQYITGLLFALVLLGGESRLEILPPFVSRPYVDLTLSALRSFGADVTKETENTLVLKKQTLHAHSCKVEGDMSNAAFLAAFNCLGSQIEILGLNPDSLQGDRVYQAYFAELSDGVPELDLSDCPDLGPVLIALAALKQGATFTGTARLKAKESDRGAAMQEELFKLGGGLLFSEDAITVPQQTLSYQGVPLSSHNDHRIAMALSVILSRTGGVLDGAESVTKSYPAFFEDIIRLGAKVKLV